MFTTDGAMSTNGLIAVVAAVGDARWLRDVHYAVR